MFLRRRSVFAISLLVILILSSGCSLLRSPAPGGPPATAQPAPTEVVIATAPIPAPTQVATVSADEKSKLLIINSCSLINSQDLAHLFPPHNEIVRNPPATSQVSHPPFSESAASGTETSCIFYDFHQPGSTSGWMLQVTYLFDVPDPSAQPAWSQAWEAAKGASSQLVAGLGDEAFISGTNLYIRTDDTYITFESIDTHVDQNTAAGMQQLIADEKQLASAGFARLK